MAAGASPARVPDETVPAPMTGELQGERETEEDGRWRPVLDLPCDLTVELLLPDFTIADLLKLRTGSLIDSRWLVSEEVPLRLNGTQIGWIEFEIVGDRLAARLTELAESEKRLRLCESLPLGERRFVAVVEFEAARFLVGGTPSSLVLLSRLEDAGEVGQAKSEDSSRNAVRALPKRRGETC
jgi:flagellar motor switch/type III secretory pathway protein FliN